MNVSEVVTQVKALGNPETTQDLAEQSFVRLLCIEQVLGLPSDRNARLSDRVGAALAAIAALEELLATPINSGSSMSELKQYHKQQAEVIGKLEALQLASSCTVTGTVSSVKFLEEFRGKAKEVIDGWVTAASAKLDTMPIAQIVAGDPNFSSAIEIIEIAREGAPISLLRLKSHPTVAFPIWALAKDRVSAIGRIFSRIAGFDAQDEGNSVASGHGSQGIVKEFSSVCACCSSRIEGESPFAANRPSYSDQEALNTWRASTDGVADKQWREARRRELVVAIKEACEAYGIKTIASRQATKWIEEFPEELKGIALADTGNPDVIYHQHLEGVGKDRDSERAMFRLES